LQQRLVRLPELIKSPMENDHCRMSLKIREFGHYQNQTEQSVVRQVSTESISLMSRRNKTDIVKQNVEKY